MSDVEVAWLAGLLEGEGSFMNLSRSRRPDRRPRLSCMMTDRDIIERIGTVTGVGQVANHALSRGSLGHKPLYRWALTRAAEVRDLCELLRPHMGERRRASIDSILDLLADIVVQPEGHCRHGHKIEGGNAVRTGPGTATCRTCRNARRRRSAAAARAA